MSSQDYQDPRSKHLEVLDHLWYTTARRKSSQASLRSIRSNPEYHYSSPDSTDSSPGGSFGGGGYGGSLSIFNNNTTTSGSGGGYYLRHHRRSSPSRLSSECRSASDLSSMLLQHQYNQQLLRIRRLNSYYAGRLLCVGIIILSCSTA